MPENITTISPQAVSNWVSQCFYLVPWHSCLFRHFLCNTEMLLILLSVISLGMVVILKQQMHLISLWSFLFLRLICLLNLMLLITSLSFKLGKKCFLYRVFFFSHFDFIVKLAPLIGQASLNLVLTLIALITLPLL